MTRNRRSLPISDIFLETSSFTIVNQHESPVKMMLTRGCDGSPGGAGWSPFPLLFASDGTEYDESSLLGFQGAGGDCADPERAIHLDLGEIDTDDNMEFVVPIGWHGKISFADAEYQMTGMSETLLEGSFGYQDNGYGYESLKLDFDVSFVMQLGLVRDESMPTSCRVLDYRNNFGDYAMDTSMRPPNTNGDTTPGMLDEAELPTRDSGPDHAIFANQLESRDDPSSWMFKCTIPSAAVVDDCEAVLSQMLALRPESPIVVGELGCRRFDAGNCRAEVCASGQNYVGVEAGVAQHSVGRVLMARCLVHGMNGVVANCGDFGGVCENFYISLGHIEDTRPHGNSSGNALPPTAAAAASTHK
ncbi:hypothetical protein E8E14_011814 [Neopestalotiopsis sp. 37M]|nr:hypothetical protein E8E14_011814 [Neopestalotiopsis sp. 37M]